MFCLCSYRKWVLQGEMDHGKEGEGTGREHLGERWQQVLGHQLGLTLDGARMWPWEFVQVLTSSQ